MARIRTFKPEFWDDDVVGTISRDARLLFLAVLSMADDEGLLRWTAVYVKSKAFMYDDDLTLDQVDLLMGELVTAGFVFPYVGGRAQQRLAFVVNFRRHQKINRAQPSKLPAPSLQNPAVRQMYGRRDSWLCALCGGEISQRWDTRIEGRVSVDHIVPASQGGSDFPSNIQAAHLKCNKRRGAQPLQPDESTSLGLDPDDESGTSDDVSASSPQVMTNSVNDSLPAAVNGSRPEGRGKGREGRGNARAAPPQQPSRIALATAMPPRKCPQHLNDPNPPACGHCKDARKAADGVPTNVPVTPTCPLHPDQLTGSRDCRRCVVENELPPTDFRSRIPSAGVAS